MSENLADVGRVVLCSSCQLLEAAASTLRARWRETSRSARVFVLRSLFGSAPPQAPSSLWMLDVGCWMLDVDGRAHEPPTTRSHLRATQSLPLVCRCKRLPQTTHP